MKMIERTDPVVNPGDQIPWELDVTWHADGTVSLRVNASLLDELATDVSSAAGFMVEHRHNIGTDWVASQTPRMEELRRVLDRVVKARHNPKLRCPAHPVRQTALPIGTGRGR